MPWLSSLFLSSYSAVYVWAVSSFRTDNPGGVIFAPFISQYLFLSPSQLHDNLAEYRILKLQTSSEFCRIYFIDLYFTELYNSEASLSLAPLDIIWVCSCFVCYFSLIGFSKVFILYPWNIEIRHLASLDVYFFSFILPARLSLRRII